MLFWNINGVKEKFQSDDVIKLFHSYEVVVIMETHFVVRHKCPDGYNLIGRSAAVNSKVGRGGVAVFVKKSAELNLFVFDDVCKDAVIFGIKNTNSIFIAPYIPPVSSIYKEKRNIRNLRIHY